MKKKHREIFTGEIAKIDKAGLLRKLRVTDTQYGSMKLTIKDGSDEFEAINFCGNDYLGLAASGVVNDILSEAAKSCGAGASASRLISGSKSSHFEFERKISSFLGMEKSVLFPSGFQANLGTIHALSMSSSVIISDSLNHASLIDGCRFAKTKTEIIPHLDLDALEKVIENQELSSDGNKIPLLVIESLYSMDGTSYDFKALKKIKENHDFILMLDEAHGFAAYGKSGKGISELSEALDIVDVYVGTLGKACGLWGAFVASTNEIIELLVNRSRSFVFTTAPTPALAASAIKVLEIIEKKTELREKLNENIKLFRSKMRENSIDCGGENFSAIVPIIIGSPEKTMATSRKLLEAGFFVQGIRPPTVPENSSRLRVTISAMHEKSDIEELADKIIEFVN